MAMFKPSILTLALTAAGLSSFATTADVLFDKPSAGVQQIVGIIRYSNSSGDFLFNPGALLRNMAMFISHYHCVPVWV